MTKGDPRLRRIVTEIARRFGIEIHRYKRGLHDTAFVSLRPDGADQGSVLLAYIIEPFLLDKGLPLPSTHTNYWESWQIAQTFLSLGYSVDAISYLNRKFVPKKDYSFYIGARTSFERTAELLNQDCIKIVHLDTAHWIFNNSSEYNRLLNLQKRKGITLKVRRMIESNWAIEYADYATVLGNDFTVSTYRYAQKPTFSLSVPTCFAYPWPEHRDLDACRNHFLWFGSGGLVHKGLDLVLEAFSGMPDHTLTVCGPVQEEEEFELAFYKELYQTPNIHTVGWVDVGSPQFMEIASRCTGLVYPSCSEGQSGAVVTCLQAGLIPIISYESGVDIGDFGLILHECSIEEIRSAVQMISSRPANTLEQMARKTWEFARQNNSREKYAQDYHGFASQMVSARRQQ
jgi:glycosyltransferase involved in cell wall biosynthesis